MAPIDGAALAAAFTEERQHTSSVLMPYRDQLADLALWYRQLWAESLGKEGKGTTPIQAGGTVDQHSQLQLYLDGRNDKLISLITCPTAGSGLTIPDSLAKEAGMSDLGGRPIGDLLDAFSSATADALIEASRPVRIFQIERLDEATIGALMMHFILETLITARLWRVNPFGQPAVEAGKKLAKIRLAEKSGSAT
jgi:glucose-6-phosphate isomerase